jgi:hypothetical protein
MLGINKNRRFEPFLSTVIKIERAYGTQFLAGIHFNGLKRAMSKPYSHRGMNNWRVPCDH